MALANCFDFGDPVLVQRRMFAGLSNDGHPTVCLYGPGGQIVSHWTLDGERARLELADGFEVGAEVEELRERVAALERKLCGWVI